MTPVWVSRVSFRIVTLILYRRLSQAENHVKVVSTVETVDTFKITRYQKAIKIIGLRIQGLSHAPEGLEQVRTSSSTQDISKCHYSFILLVISRPFLQTLRGN